MSRKTLYRHWLLWAANRSEAAFPLRYVPGRSCDIDPLLLQLLVACCVRESKTVSEVLVSVGAGDRKGRPSLSTIYRSLPARSINRFVRDQRKLITDCERAVQKRESLERQLGEMRAAAEQRFLPELLKTA